MKKNNRFFSTLYIIFCFAFFYLPILVTMLFSFNSSKSLTHFTGFSFKWYKALIENNEIMSAVYVSISIAIISTIISTILGTITAIGLSKNKKIVKELILNINNISITNPDIVTAISLMLLFSSFKMEKGYLTMLLAHIAFSTPYVITSVYPKVRGLDPNIANAALDLGATPFQALYKVIIPMIKPGIFAGILLAFTMSFDDFVISYFVSGNGVMNISIIVYNMTKRTNPTINALSTIVIVVIFITLIIVNLVPKLSKNKVRVNKYIKTGISLLLVIALIIPAFIGFNTNKKNTLKVFNAGEYILKDLLTEFQEKYDCEVIYETFDSNESMYTKVASGEMYDIIIPSDYMVERLIKEEYLQKIDWSLIPNKDNIMESVINKDFDPKSEYTAPYFHGTVGILYNKNVVDEKDLEAGWELLRNPKYKNDIYMYDSERDSFMIALKALGYSMNTTSKKEFKEAYDWLVEQRELVSPIYAGDDVIDSMISGNKSIAIVYSGDAAYIMSENPELEYFTPKQGTNLWFDSMVITNDCINTDLAHKFINFMLDNENALLNSEEVGYTSGIKEAFEEMKNGAYDGISAYVPTPTKNDEIFKYQEPELKKYCADLWVKVKAE